MISSGEGLVFAIAIDIASSRPFNLPSRIAQVRSSRGEAKVLALESGLVVPGLPGIGCCCIAVVVVVVFEAGGQGFAVAVPSIMSDCALPETMLLCCLSSNQ